MKCEVFRGNKKVMGPMEYDVSKIKSYVTRQGCDESLLPRILTGRVNIATISIMPIREVKPNLIPGKKYGPYTRRESGDEIIYDYPLVSQTREELLNKHLKRLAELHDEYENGRAVYEGVAIKVDMEARINAKATLDLFKDGVLTATEWRGIEAVDTSDPHYIPGSEGKATIPVNSLQQMASIYGAIIDYLARGFNARSKVEDEIKLLTNTQLATFDSRSRFMGLAKA